MWNDVMNRMLPPIDSYSPHGYQSIRGQVTKKPQEPSAYRRKVAHWGGVGRSFYVFNRPRGEPHDSIAQFPRPSADGPLCAMGSADGRTRRRTLLLCNDARPTAEDGGACPLHARSAAEPRGATVFGSWPGVVAKE